MKKRHYDYDVLKKRSSKRNKIARRKHISHKNSTSHSKRHHHIRHKRDVVAHQIILPPGVKQQDLDTYGYACVCPVGWKGRICVGFDSWHPDPCLNNGKCIEKNGNYECKCDFPLHRKELSD
jgi:hypothetical protein